MQWLSALSVRRPVFASVLILALVVVGGVSYARLGVDKFPNIDFPIVVVTTIYPGASPTAVETDVTDKIEAAVNTVSGIDTLSSISTEGASMVVVQFALDKDPDVAAQEMRDKVGLIKDLPGSIDPPAVQKLDPGAAPVINFAVRGPVGGEQNIRELTRIAETMVKRRLESISGVGQVQIIGGQKRQIRAVVDPARLRAYGISALEVQRAIGISNTSIPGGRLDRGANISSMRIDGRATTPTELGDIIVRQVGNTPVSVRDLILDGKIEDTLEDAKSYALRDGQPTILISVTKQSGANTITVVDTAKAALASIQDALPPGYAIDVVRDNSELVRTSTSQVLEHLVVGGLLAALVVLLFLGDVRSTIIASISIPVSIIGSFLLMAWAGFTLNMMTLLALALAVGIVIDDSIVVLENIHRYIEEKGYKPFPAAIAATKEIGLAVMATTLSLMAVFLPVAFMSGIVGRFLSSFGLTMAFAILVSMLVSFTLTPMMAARMLKPHDATRTPSVLARFVERFYRPIERWYLAMLRWSMHHRWVIVLISVGLLAITPMLAGKAGGGFMPENDEAHFEIYLKAKEGTSLDATTILAERVARETRALPGVAHTLLTVGANSQEQPNSASIYVRLVDPNQRDMSQDEIMELARTKVLSQVPEGTTVAAQLVADFSVGTQNSLIAYVITGPDLDRLERTAKAVLEEFKKVPGVADAATSVVAPMPETTIRPDLKRAAALGVDPGDIVASLRLFIAGSATSTFEDRGEQYDVVVRAPERFRSQTEALAMLSVPSRTLGSVPLSDVVAIDQGTGPAQINRLSRMRQVSITSNLAPGGKENEIMASLGKLIDKQNLPAGYKAEPFGRSRESAKVGQAFAFAFFLAFVFMYLVLAAQFESWVHPLTILICLPLTVPFAMMAVLLFGIQLDIFSMLGLLVLFGVVKKNSILQIDQANQLRASGMPRFEAIMEANRHRLRPILMTTIAFVAGMMPLVMSQGIGSGFSKSMASIVVGGQTLSLLLTLLATPVFYSLFDDAGLWVKRVLARFFGGAAIDRGEAEVMSAPEGQVAQGPADK